MKRNPLRSLTLMVVSKSTKFVETWTKILNLCGCVVVRAIHSSVFAVVADSAVSQRVVEHAREQDVPVVNAEWAAQCLINWRVLDRDNPRYTLQ